MHTVTMVGNAHVGKSALCERWMSGSHSDSYISTIMVHHYVLPGLTIHDTPSDKRFHVHIEKYYASTDVFILVANQDTDFDHWYARIAPLAPDASWFLLWTGSTPCPLRTRWAMDNEIPLMHVNTSDADQIGAAFTTLKVLAQQHVARPPPVALGYVDYYVGEARQWLPCV